MSSLNIYDIIKGCANAYRTASGTTELVPVGDLEGLISALTAGGGEGLVYDMGEFVLTSNSNIASSVPHNLGEVPDFIAVWTDDFKDDDTEYEVTPLIGFVWMRNLTGLKQRFTSTTVGNGFTVNFTYSRTQKALYASIPTSQTYTVNNTSNSQLTATTFPRPKIANSEYWYAGITYKYFVSKAWWNTELGGDTSAE